PGMAGFVYALDDISDPAHPVELGRFWLEDQELARPVPAQRPSHHGPAYPVGDRAYLPYGSGGMVILDISDAAAPRLVSRLDFGAAFSSQIALHTVIPLPERKLAVVNTEAIAERSEEPYNFAGIV